MRFPSAVLALPLAAASLCPTLAFAQAPVNATITGVLKDAKGLPVAGASVIVLDLLHQDRRIVQSSRDGGFLVSLLQPGEYSLEVTGGGLGAQIPAFVLQAGDRRAFEIGMRVLGPNSEVAVVSDTSLQETPTVGTVIDREMIDNLPLNGRSLQSLISLAPGAVPDNSDTLRLGQFVVNGQRSTTNYFTVDGVAANTGIESTGTGLVGGSGYSAGYNAVGSTSSMVTADSLEEFRIQTSTFAPEFGRTPGGQVSLITRSGSNTYHGSAFEYFRNDKLDANDWFRNSLGLKRAPLRQNQFGGTLGGPIVHSRTFAFFSYEGLRLVQPQAATTISVPNRAARALATEPLKTYANAFPLAAESIDTSGLQLASATTATAKAALANNILLPISYSNKATSDVGSVRVDQQLDQHWSVFARYNKSFSEQRSPNGVNQIETSYKQQAETVALLWSANRYTNDLRANWTTNAGKSASTLTPTQGAQAVPDNSPLLNGQSLPVAKTQTFIGVDGTAGGGFSDISLGPSSQMSQKQINIVDTFGVQAGSHQLKFGGDFRYLLPIYYTAGYLQYVQFNNWQEALAGQTYYIYIATLGGPYHPRAQNLSLFAQDTWKATDRLTLTYGTRWELNPAPTERDNKGIPALHDVNNFAKIGLSPAGTKLYPTQYGNFAPRVGFSYRVHDDPHGGTVLRGGTGVFYQIASDQVFQAYDSQIGPFTSANTFLNAPYPGPPSTYVPPALTDPQPPYSYVSAFDPNLQSPLSLHWNLTLEQDLGEHSVLSTSYVASLGRRLYRTENYPDAGANFQTLFVTRNTASSLYDSLQVQFQRQMGQGAHLLASYTWAHSTDTLSNEYYGVLPGEQAGDRADSDADRRNVFTAALDWAMPTASHGFAHSYLVRDWRVDSTFKAYTGQPINVVYFVSNFLPQLRPNVVAGQPLWLYDRKLPGGRQINPAAFALPAAAGNGNSPRNGLRGFGSTQWDVALQRTFPIHDRIKMQFRMEAFNVLNTANFSDPSGSAYTPNFANSNPNFGQSRSTLGRGLGGLNPLYQFGGPRSLQAALRVNF